EVFRKAGRVLDVEDYEGSNSMYHVPDVGRFLEAILPELQRRAVDSGVSLPLELGLSGDDRHWLLHVDANRSRIEPEELSRRHLTLSRAAFVGLAMGHTGSGRAIAEDGVESSAGTAGDAARILFPIRPLWRS